MANVPAFLLNKYAPLALPQVLNDMPQDYLKILPRFNGENEVDAHKHLENFCSFAENLNVEHLDVVLRLFVQSLEGEARKWFKTLADHSVNTWDRMEDLFLRKWGEKKDHGMCLTEFNTLKKKHKEGVAEFIKIFNKLYLSLPPEMKPHEAAAKIIFIAAFDSDFGFSLRERKPATLDDA